MKNKSKIILIVIIIIEALVIVGLSLLLVFNNNKKQNNNSINETEYYDNMVYTMGKYYNIYFKNMPVAEDMKDKQRNASLQQLERFGFPIDSFVEYETNEKCDLTKSYAVALKRNGKNYIEVYYQCGEDSNYRS